MIKNDRRLYELKYWRGVLGLKQDDMAALLGCKKSNYCQKENGKTEINRSEMLLIQQAFNKKRIKNGQAPLTLDEIFLNKELRKVND